MRILRTALLTVAGGVLLAVVLFMISLPPVVTILGGPGTVVTRGQPDFWTGEMTPMIVTTNVGQATQAIEYPQGQENHRVIPLPVGFVAGSVLTLGLIAISGRRKASLPPAVSPASNTRFSRDSRGEALPSPAPLCFAASTAARRRAPPVRCGDEHK